MPETSDLDQHEPLTGAVGDSTAIVDATTLLDEKDRSVTDTVRSACLEDGFFFIEPGRQQRAAIDATLRAMQSFFSLDDDDARKRDVLAGESRRGWRPRYTEPAYQPDTISSLEAFDLGKDEINAGDPYDAWPAVDGFRDAASSCWTEFLRLADRTLEVIAEAAGLDRSTFVSRCRTRRLNSLRLLHYAGGGANTDDRSVGISAHTDFECITLLYQSAPGLELRRVDGSWLDSAASTGRLVVMLDDMLERWTNGFFKATGHRVRETTHRRFSIVLFVAVDADEVVSPLPPFVSASRPSRYPPVTQGDHLRTEIARAVDNARKTTRTR